MRAESRKKVIELAGLFLLLGFTAFGGPAVYIAMLHNEVVSRRRWMTDGEFLDMVSATNLIPGPNSTEMAMHVGYRKGGLRGLLVSGAAYIIPAALMVTALAWAYVQFGALPQAEAVLAGVKPVVIILILQALWRLGRALKGPLIPLGVLVFVLYLAGVNELLLLAGGGLAVVLFRAAARGWGSAAGLLLLPGGWKPVVPVLSEVPFTLSRMFFTLLKIGAVLYGGGYTLFAFLHTDFVLRYGWLTDRQLIDAIAIGQVTPGPLFTTATFIGYFLGGFPGALLATLGIFLPSFILVAALNPLIPRIRDSQTGGSMLDGVNAASLGLIAGVTIQLAGSSLIDLRSWLLAAAAGLLLFRFRINSVWLVLGGAAVGLLLFLL